MSGSCSAEKVRYALRSALAHESGGSATVLFNRYKYGVNALSLPSSPPLTCHTPSPCPLLVVSSAGFSAPVSGQWCMGRASRTLLAMEDQLVLSTLAETMRQMMCQPS